MFEYEVRYVDRVEGSTEDDLLAQITGEVLCQSRL